MSKTTIISFADAKLRLSEQPEDRDAIWSVMVEPAIQSAITEVGLKPRSFSVNEQSKLEFYEKPIFYKDEDDAFGSIYYDCRTLDTIYRAECRITFNEDSVTTDTEIYMLPDYHTGNREWLYFDKDWLRGPGDDLFDVVELLKTPLREVKL